MKPEGPRRPVVKWYGANVGTRSHAFAHLALRSVCGKAGRKSCIHPERQPQPVRCRSCLYALAEVAAAEVAATVQLGLLEPMVEAPPPPPPEAGPVRIQANRRGLETLAQATEWLEAHLDDGADCPCCGQTAKVYRRKLNAEKVRALAWLASVSSPSSAFVHLSTTAPAWVLAAGGEVAKLRHWGLAEQAPNDNPKTRTSGHWRVTARGLAFLNGASAPAHVLLFNNKVVGFAEADTTVVEAAQAGGFDYRALMEGGE